MKRILVISLALALSGCGAYGQIKSAGHVALTKAAKASEAVVCGQSLPLSVYLEEYVLKDRSVMLTNWCQWDILIVPRKHWGQPIVERGA